MVKEIALKWIERLPKHKQGQRNLRLGDLHCCMGVLCEMATEAGITTRRKLDIDNDRYSYGGYDASYPPLAVCEWAGLQGREGYISNGILRDSKGVAFTSLVDMNDHGCSFEEIAKAIEKNWEFL